MECGNIQVILGAVGSQDYEEQAELLGNMNRGLLTNCCSWQHSAFMFLQAQEVSDQHLKTKNYR